MWRLFQAIAAKVQSLLVSGRRKEALQCAQEGQLWGPALVLAAQLGDKVRATFCLFMQLQKHLDDFDVVIDYYRIDNSFD